MRTFTRLLSIAIVFLMLVTPKNSISQTMFPGDVNNNGIVNGVDALYWNLAIGATGNERPNATTDFTEQDLPNPLWGTTFSNGLDFAFADCDGNGVIDELDFMDGIFENCGATHGVITPDEYFNGTVGVDPRICLDPESDQVFSGETLNIDINLGDEDMDIEDFQAITFTMSYDGEFVEEESNFLLDLTESWADPSGTGEGTESYAKNYEEIEMGEITILRTASSVQNGQGKIGRVSIIIEDQIVGLVTNDTLTIKIEDVRMLNQLGNSRRVAPDCEVKVKILEPRSAANCPQIVNPVCGDDGVTYINCCYAAAAGVTNFTTGVCYSGTSGCIDETQMNPDANCSYTYNPVCGCNDVTYLNACVAEAKGITLYTQGTCSDACYDPTYVNTCAQTTTDPVSGVVTNLCPQVAAPVCGCDGITYTNSCYAQASGMSFYTPGPCADNCVDANSMDPNLLCPSAYNPVCGCNDVSYTNSCYAEAAGVLNYTPGSCGSSPWCAQATPISCGDYLPNETSIGESNNINTYPTCSTGGFAGPDKVYVINKNTSGDLQIGIEIMTPGMDLDMFLLADNCNQVTCVKSSTTSNANSNNEGIIFEDAPIGTYYLVIDGQYASSAGNFRLEVNCGYLNCDNSVSLTCGVPVSLNNSEGTDEVSLYGCDGNVLNVENNGPEMIHTFTTTSAGPVDISLYGCTANLELFLLRSCDRGDCVDYSQNPGTSNENIQAYLQPGTYYVVVDGYNGAVGDYNLLVNCATNCQYDITATATDANCGQNNGEINISSTGGDSGFIIQWDGPVSGSFSTYGTNCTISGLPGGTYIVTGIDANGCEDTAEVVIGNSETDLNVTATPNDAICGSQGSISINIANGVPYFQIFMSGPSSGSTLTALSSFNIINLDPGTYTLQIVDANGCSNTQEVVIGQTAGDFNWTYTVTDAACGGTGSIHVVTQNGDPSYNILVSGPTSGSATTQYPTFNLNNLPGGTYQITIEDDNWCQVTQTVVIEDSNLTISLDANGGYCGSNGSIDVNMSNGAPSYNVSWTGPTAGSVTTGNASFTIPNLTNGTYSITVIDAAGCSDYQVIQLLNSGANINFEATANNGSCGQPGSVWLEVLSGAGPYTISWNGPASGSVTTPYENYEIPWLPDGTYSIQVTDADGCSETDDVTINNSMNNLEINTTPTNGICDQPGSIWVSISNGIPGYSISWSGASSGSTTTNNASYDIQNLPVGIYNITITDGAGCQVTTEAEVGSTGSNLNVTGTGNAGACGAPGSIDLMIANGAAGTYRVAWSGPTSGTATTNLSNYSITNLVSGIYNIMVKDVNECVSTTTIVIGVGTNNLLVTGDAINGFCGNNGSINLDISGGASPFTIGWSGAESGSVVSNQSNVTISDLISGTYNIVITDNSGCMVNTSITVDNGVNDVIVTATSNNGSCSNAGTIDLVFNGGDGDYDVSWTGATQGTATPSGNTFTITNALQGNYDITLTDGNGCTSTTTTVINNSANPFSITGESTDGACDQLGSLWVFMHGGTPNFLVEWDGPVSGSALTTAVSYDVANVPSGTYNITVTDANGCVGTTVIVVNNQGSNIVVIATGNSGQCGALGSVMLSLEGGTPPYAINYTGAATGSDSVNGNAFTIPGAVAGTYNFTITDATGCDATASATVNNNNGNAGLSLTPINGSCGNTGSIQVVATGASPFTISWSGAGSGTATSNGTYTITNATAGNYTVEVVDANGCSALQTTTISSSSDIAATSSSNDASCGSNTGSIDITVSAGSPSYTVDVDGPTSNTSSQFGNTFTLSGLAAGSYNVTITDANGCSVTISEVVNGTNPITATATGVDAACGQNGSIWIDVFNGTPDYSVSWSGPSSGSNTIGIDNFEIPNVPGGTYTITITDANGCTVTTTATVNSTSGITVTASGNDGVCGGNGSANIVITGGVANYDVTWTGASNGSNTYSTNSFTVPNLPAGSYTFSVTDGAGCTGSQTVTINGGANTLTATSSTIAADCTSGLGAVTVTVSGGSPGYTVVTTGPTPTTTTQNTGIFTLGSLMPGNYNISITDANGCSTDLTALVGGTGCCMTATMTGNDATCGSNGSIWIDVFNGTPDYTVTWSGPTSGSNTIGIDNFEIPNVPGGTYTVTVVGADGCSVTQTVIVDATGGVDFTLTPVDGECGQNGSILVAVNSGVADYTVSWTGATTGTTTTNQSNFDLSNLPAGTYNITIVDANGCSATNTVIVTAGSGTITATTSSTAADCATGLGSINVTIAGGSPGYTVTTTGPTSSTTTQSGSNFTLTGLAPGNYTIAIADANGCSTAVTTIVGGPGCCTTATFTGVDAGCGVNGSIWVDVFNGTPIYTVTWTGPSSGSNTTNLNNFEIPNLPGGTYTITLVDANNCSVTGTTQVNVVGNINIEATAVAGECGANGSANVSILSGTPGFTISWAGPVAGSNTTNSTSFNIPNLPTGTYVITVTDADGCDDVATVNVTSGSNLATSTTSINGACGADGSILVTSTNGTAPYSYTWTGGGSGTSATSQFTITDLVAGTYTIVVTDAAGCTTSNTVTLTSTPAVTFTAIANDGACGSAGSVDITVLTGTPAYTITWNGGSTATANGTINIPNLVAGTYVFTIVDSNGCTSSQTVVVATGANDLTATAVGGDADCVSGLGQIAVNVANGIPNYTVTVAGPTPGTSTQTASGFNLTGLLPGNYTLTIVDANGCSTTTVATITDTACCMTIDLTPIDGVCSGSGSIIVSIANGAPNYDITWTGGGSATATSSPYTIPGLSPGTYTVNVMDANGCAATSSVTVDATPGVTFTASPNAGVCGGAGSVDISILTGTPDYTITWPGGSVASSGGSTNIPNLVAGTYTFTVTDANGCDSNQTVTVGTGTSDLLIAAVGGNADCVSGLGQIAVTVANGTPNYTVTLVGPSAGTSTQTTNGFNLTGLTPGDYDITIVDANGCSSTVTATVTDTSCCLSTTLSSTNGVCGAGGSILVANANGAPNYTITWSGGPTITATTDLYTINNVPAGTYTITVVDANGCTTTGNITVTTPPDVTFSGSSTPGACGNPGSVDITILTGTGPYVIAGPTGNVATNGGTTNIPDLVAGAYTFTVTDSNGCSATQVVQVMNGSNDLAATAIGSDIDCTTGLGHISIAVTSGVPTYNVTVAGPTPSTTTSSLSNFNIDDLLPGDYTITIVDANGCSTIVATTVTNNICCLTATATVVTEASCGAADGSVLVSTAGGTAPYTITYTGGTPVTTAGPDYTITGLIAGSYSVTVTDAAGCDVTTTVVVGGGSEIVASATGSIAECLTGLGTITGTATGTGPYNVVIGGAGSTTVPASPFTLTGLLPGTYNLVITDANGCAATITNVVILPTDECCMTANFAATAATCDEPGEVCVEVMNGLADFTASYNTITGSGSIVSSDANFCLPNLAAGNYNITVTDAAGCEVVQTVVVADDCCIPDACFTFTENGAIFDFASNYTSSTATYTWDFGDGNFGTGANPTNVFAGNGNYDVCVTIQDDCGSDMCCETITVANGLDIVILRTGEAAGGPGNIVSVPVTSENCDMLTSFSGSLTTCDDNIAQIAGITPAAINPTFNGSNNTFTYFDFNGQGVPCDGVVLFYIDVLLVGTGGQTCDISITCAPLPCEVGGLENGTGVPVDYELADGTITIYTMFQMDGMVRTWWMDGIMAARVEADGELMDDMDMTDENGAYLFPELIGDEEYIVSPEKDTLPANGLSTFALYIGQQFILGMDPVEITSPYQVIAGDANCNNSFTALDLFLIQQIIIGTATEFPSCPSWVFVNEDHPLPADFNTFNVFPYEDSATLQLDQDSYANFVGVKVGDILGNANPQNISTPAVDTRDRNDLTFNTKNGSVKSGETFVLDFTSTEFENYVSFQMALDFDTEKMEFVEVINNEYSEMSNLISGISARQENQVRFSWFNLEGKPTRLDDTEIAFSVKFKATEDIADLSKLFGINMFDTFNAEAHDQYAEPFNIVLEFVDSATETEIANGDYKLLQNTPNPFTNNTIIRFELPEAMHAKLIVTNTLGQVVAEFANEYPKGMSQVEWKRNDLPSGLYNYTLTTDSYSESKSMIIID